MPLHFTECLAPFERGCVSAEEFNATRLFTVVTCVILSAQAQGAVQKLNRADSAFTLPAGLSHLKRIIRVTTPSSSTSCAAALSSQQQQQRPTEVEILLCRKVASDPVEARENRYDDVPLELQNQVAAELGFRPLSFHVKRAPPEPISPAEWYFANAVWPLSVPKTRTRMSDPSLFSQNMIDAVAGAFAVIDDKLKGARGSAMAAAVVDLTSKQVLATFVSALPTVLPEDQHCCFPYPLAPASDGAAGSDSSAAPVFVHPVFEVLRLVSKKQAEQQPPQQSGGAAAAASSSSSSGAAYLCTSLAVVTSHEPCVMCSMALVHSRTAMAFFRQQNTVHGGLGGVQFANRIPSLNHRFPSYLVE